MREGEQAFLTRALGGSSSGRQRSSDGAPCAPTDGRSGAAEWKWTHGRDQRVLRPDEDLAKVAPAACLLRMQAGGASMGQGKRCGLR